MRIPPTTITARPPNPVATSCSAVCMAQITQERRPNLHERPRLRCEFLTATPDLLKCGDLAETLHGIDREGAQVAGGLAGA